MRRFSSSFPLWAAALLLAAVLAPPARAQFNSYPGQGYFAALDELHSADYRRAERAMRGELRGAAKTLNSRWLDSICFAAGLGEALYQQGRLAESLAQFDAALDLFLDQSNWMMRVQWQQGPREDTSLGRRLPAWAAGEPAVYADMPRTFLYQYGRLDNTAVQQQGGVVQVAQYWKLDCEELSRAIAWTLYRRGDLMGPLGAYDERTQAVATRLAGGGLGPAGHWTSAWIELWQGLAKGASGDAIEALPHLQQAALLGGRMRHRLTGLSLLAQGRLAAGSGDGTTGAALLGKAISCAAAYEDFDTLAEAVRALHTLSMVDSTVQPPPLAAIATWAERGGVQRVALDARLGMIERAIVAGDTTAAKKALATLFRRSRDATLGWMGREGERLNALIATAGPYNTALAQARTAAAAQQDISRRIFQTRMANAWYDDGRLSKRLARQAYADVLGDPGMGSWNADPLDALASNASLEPGAFQRWFDAALDRRDPVLALQIIDQKRRREFFAGQPLAGRLVGVRWLLEAPDAALPPLALELRARVEAASPEYRERRLAGIAASEAMLAALAEEDDGGGPALRRAGRDLVQSLDDRERLVLRTSLSRTPTPLAFPPSVDPVAAKQRMKAGEAVVAFHVHIDEMYGVVLTSQGEHLWRVGPVDEVNADVERLLREVVGTTPKQTWKLEELNEATWRDAAQTLASRLLADSRLDASSLERLWIVPDGSLWRAPLGLLPIPDATGSERRLGDVALTYAPTPGWAVRPRADGKTEAEGRPTWSIVADPKSTPPVEGLDSLEAVARATSPPRGLDAGVSVVKALAGVVAIDVGSKPPAVDPLGLPLTPANSGDREVAAWSSLPWGGPSVVAVRSLGGGEAGGGKVRRSKKAVAIGAPEFQVVASLLSGGAQTVLLERWPTGGAKARDFVAEWLNGLGRLDAQAAWERSLALGRNAPLDLPREPRLEAGANAVAEHPVWWSGYLLVD